MSGKQVGRMSENTRQWSQCRGWLLGGENEIKIKCFRGSEARDDDFTGVGNSLSQLQ